MSASKRFCLRGHDTAVCGRGKQYECLECRRERNKGTAHARTSERRLIERRSKRKARTERDLARLRELGWQS